jgi:platelet-activating factor acetylhydrolase IB subunit alpha
MVLTDRQRTDLHAGIYEYLLSRGPEFASAATALATADPEACQSKSPDDESKSSPTKRSSSSDYTPLLEKKWTAVPRLQKRVLDLEKQLATTAKHHAHRNAALGLDASDVAGGGMGRERRFLPRNPCAHTLQSHSAGVATLAVHPIYTMTASGSEDGTIKLWDYESGDYLRTLRGHTNVVTGVDFSPSGVYLVSCSTDLSVKVWEVKDNYACVRTLRGHDHTISDVKFVPPSLGAVYLSGGEKTVAGSGVDAASAQAKFVVTASRDGTIKFWDLETGFCDATTSDHGDWVRCLAVRGAKGNVGGEQKSDADETSTDSLVLVASSGNDRTIYVYNAYDKREKVAELRGHDHVVEALSFLCSTALPQEKKAPAAASRTKASTPNTFDYLASASRDRTVRLWSVSNGGSCLMTFRAHENWVRGVMVHPSGNYVLSCGDDRTIRVFDVKVFTSFINFVLFFIRRETYMIIVITVK